MIYNESFKDTDHDVNMVCFRNVHLQIFLQLGKVRHLQNVKMRFLWHLNAFFYFVIYNQKESLLETVPWFLFFVALIAIFMMFYFINQREYTFTYLRIYLHAWLHACFLPSLLTYLLISNSIYNEMLLNNWKVPQNCT